MPVITSTTTLVPDNPAAAYAVYRQAASAVFLAGTQGLKYKKDHYDLAVDLSKAGLTYIDERADEIVIGAMTPVADQDFPGHPEFCWRSHQQGYQRRCR